MADQRLSLGRADGRRSHSGGGLTTNRAIFLDRDGTINREVHYLSHPDQIALLDGVPDALQALQERGFVLIVVTNQAGIARGYFSIETLESIHERLIHELAAHGIHVDDILYCPHHPNGSLPEYTGACSCRKPQPGLLLAAAEKHGIDLKRSFLIGDKLSDIAAGNRAGCQTILVRTGYGSEHEQTVASAASDDHSRPNRVCDDLLDASQLILSDSVYVERRGGRRIE